MISNALNYRAAGVDIDAGNELVKRIKPLVQATQAQRPGVLGHLGGFGGLFELPLDRYQHPVLVSGTDGVGTKLILALDSGKHDSIGIDLVAMCVNDIVVCGAEPLFFLDYYATGKLDIETANSVIASIATGCQQAGAALIGGETAEMPGMYQGGDYDLAGFAVGIVEKANIIDGRTVQPGDALIGIASSGPHSNGYSLIRKILDLNKITLTDSFTDSTYQDILLAPTRIYVKPLLELFEQVEVKALAHITGGGLSENLPRVLPNTVCAVVDSKTWIRPPIFDWLQQQGGIEDKEMWRTFNCGIGMAICVAQQDVDTALENLRESGETAWQIGTVKQRQNDADSDPAIIIES